MSRLRYSIDHFVTTAAKIGSFHLLEYISTLGTYGLVFFVPTGETRFRKISIVRDKFPSCITLYFHRTPPKNSLEPKAGIEPATPSLRKTCSTN